MEAKRHYSPSWVDRLFERIERLPLPIGPFYLLVYFASAVGLHVASWLNGTTWGSISLVQLYSAIWLPLVFFVIHSTDQVASEAITGFAPALRARSSKLEDIRYRITTMPSGVVLGLSLIGATIVLAGAISDSALIFYDAPIDAIHPVSWLIAGFIGISSYSMAPVMIYHAIRQLKLVTEAYKLVGNVNIFHQQPLYSFSGLTMRTAFFFLLMVYFSYLGEFLYEASASETAINLGISIVIVPLSIVIVILPLWGIHQRLARAKQAALEENGTKIEHVQEEIYTVVEKNKYTQTKELEAALRSLFQISDRLTATPTWPWNPGALRNFLSAVFLPLGLWALQQVLSRLFAG
ncbi:MAG: hypothetical protein WD740_06125 [Anaerolineales bacterium]